MIKRRVCLFVLCIAIIFSLFAQVKVCKAEEQKTEACDFVEINIDPFSDPVRIKLYQGFDFINTDSSYCNWKQALNAAVLSKSIYDGDVSKMLRKIGYDIISDLCGSIDPESGLPGFAVAYKLIIDEQGNKKNVFAFVVRGTCTDSDFYTDFWDGGLTMFSVTTDELTRFFKTAVQEITGTTWEELIKQDNYVFLTGHSLGGAVANKMSVKSEIAELTANNKGKVYTYTFEAPFTCSEYIWEGVHEKSNAYNFVDRDDWITMLPPHLNGARYGTDKGFFTDFLNERIFQALVPNAEEKSNRDIYDHHIMIGDFVYILQRGNLFDKDYESLYSGYKVWVDGKEKTLFFLNDSRKEATPRLSEIDKFIRLKEDGPWSIYSKEIYQYDDNGNIIGRRLYTADGQIKESEIIEYDYYGKIVKKTQTLHYCFEHELYKGFLEHNCPDGEKYITSYDEQGKIKKIKVYKDNHPYIDFDFEYEEADTNPTVRPHMWMSTAIADSPEWEHEGDWVRDDPFGAYHILFDERGNIVEVIFHGKGAYEWHRKNEYDSNGNCTRTTLVVRQSWDEDEEIYEDCGWTYDDSGNLTRDWGYSYGADAVTNEYIITYEEGDKHTVVRTIGGGYDFISYEYWENEEFFENSNKIKIKTYKDYYQQNTTEYTYRNEDINDKNNFIESIIVTERNNGFFEESNATYYIYEDIMRQGEPVDLDYRGGGSGR